MTSPFVIAAYLSWVVLIVVWLPGYFSTRITAKGPRPVAQIASTALLFTSFLVLFASGVRGLSMAVTPRTTGFEVTGLVFDYAGVGFAIWARRTLGRHWSDVVMSVNEDHELVQTGPYAIVRHPIYTGILLALLGTALTFGALLSYVSVVTGLIALMMRISVEEKLMSGQFGAAHEAYRRQAKKLVPFVW